MSGGVRFIQEAPNGSSIAISGGNFFTKPTGYENWIYWGYLWQEFPLHNSPTVTINTKFTFLSGNWYNAGHINGALYSSADGVHWNACGVPAIHTAVTERNGDIFAVTSNSTTCGVAKTSDGVSWEFLTTTGLPSGSNLKIGKLLQFNGSLVVLIDQRIYFSTDGVGWLQASLPSGIVDMASGNDQLVVVLSSGGILQTGNLHSGESAPIVNIKSPHAWSQHVLGADVILEGEVFDPEEGDVNYKCYVDGQLMKQGRGRQFSFKFTASDLAGHLIRVVAEDSHGLQQSDSISLAVTDAEPNNRFVSGEGVSHLPVNHVVELGGLFYVAGERVLYRSSDGENWGKVVLPSLKDDIYAMVSGNGALVVQFANGSVIATRDGINWVHVTPNQTDHWINSPLRFESGRFIVAYYVSGGGSGSVMTSIDGLSWDVGRESQEGKLSWQAVNHDGVIIGKHNFYGESVIYQSLDAGMNWKPIVDAPIVGYYNTNGIFAGGKFVVVDGGLQKVYVSPDADTWTTVDVPQFDFIQYPQLYYQGDCYFAGPKGSTVYCSSNGENWQRITTAEIVGQVVYGKGQYVGLTANGVAISSDGIIWQEIEGSSIPAAGVHIVVNVDRFLVVTSGGGVWSSTDGKIWTKTVQGKEAPPIGHVIKKTPLEIESLSGRLILVGERGLISYSDDNGKSWQPSLVNGAPQTYGYDLVRLKSSGQSALTSTLGSSGGALFHTTDGIEWTSVTGVSDIKIVDFDYNGSEWMALGTKGELIRSTDGGLTWTDVSAPAIETGAAISWFQSKWIHT